MFTLITGVHAPMDLRRNAEYLTCIARNLENRFISEMILLIEETEPFWLKQCLGSKARTVTLGRRLVYRDLFSQQIAPNNFLLATNADIWFDDSLINLASRIGLHSFIALSKWNGDKLFAPEYSQDSWIMRPETGRELQAADWTLGEMGCESRLNQLAHTKGLCLYNPSPDVHAHHEHASAYRVYDHKKLHPGPYRMIRPCPVASMHVVDSRRMCGDYSTCRGEHWDPWR